MQGIYVNYKRPSSKKAVKEAIAANPSNVSAEATNLFGNEFSGPISEMPDGTTITFVGPDPYTKRNFYGTIKKVNGKITVS